MRRLMHTAAALAALLWSAPAWAVVANSQVTITSGGTPVAGATVSLSTPQTAAAPKRRPTATRTNSQGTTTITFDDEDARQPGLLVDVTVSARDGSVRMLRMPLAQLAAGRPIDVARAATSPQTPAGLPSDQFYIPGTNTLVRVDGYVRYGSNFAGDNAGLGVVVVPGDPFLLRYRDRVPTWTTGGSVHFDVDDMMHRVGVSYTRGSTRTNAEVPAGNNVGFISGNPADPGTNFGPFGAQASGRVSLDRFNVTYNSMRAFNLDNGFEWGWPGEADERKSYKRLGWAATFDYTKLDYSGHLQRTPDPNVVYADVYHRLSSYEYLFGPAISGRRMIGGNFYVLGKGDVQGGLRTSSLDTREVTCFGCGGAANTVNLSNSKTSFAWKANVEVGVGVELMPNLTAELTAGLTWGNFAIADVRENPADHGTRIRSVTDYDSRFGFNIRYGR